MARCAERVLPLAALLCTCLGAGAGEAAGYDHWLFDLEGGAGEQGVATTLGGRLVRVIIASKPSRKEPPAIHVGYGDAQAEELRQLSAAPAAQQLGGIAVGNGLSGTGTLLQVDLKGDGRPVAVEFAIGRTGDGQLSGSVTIAGRKLSVAGRFRPEAEAARLLAVPTTASWPMTGGVNGDFTTSAQQEPPALAESAGYRLAWVSQDIMTSSSAGARMITAPNGGSAGPILHRGRIHQYYYVPAGPLVDEGLAKERNPLPPPWNRTLADDVMVALDAATGRTLWRTVAPLAGATYAPHKPEMQGHTMVADGDRVFAVGSGGMVYGLEAATGKILWRTPSPADRALHEAVAAMAASGTRDARYRRPSNRSSGHSPAIAAGVVVVPASTGGGLCGLDAGDGRVMWSRDAGLADNASPLVWRPPGGERIIVVGRATGEREAQRHAVACLDPRSGADLWVSEPLGAMPYGATLNGDLLFANVGTQAEGQDARLACFRLSEAGLQPLWRAADAVRGGVFSKVAGSQAMRLGDAVYARVWPALPGGHGLGVMALADGTARAAPELPWDNPNETAGVGLPGLLLWFREWQHGSSLVHLFDTSGRALGTWNPPLLPSCTPYQNPGAGSPIAFDGRFLIRGMDGLYCYDLRAGR